MGDTVILGIFGLLLTGIGVLVLARLVFVTSQVDALWKELKGFKSECSDRHIGISKEIGVLQGKINPGESL